MYKGGSRIIKLKGTKKRVKWTATNTRIIRITRKGKYKVKVKAMETGLTTVIAKVKGKKYRCRLIIF